MSLLRFIVFLCLLLAIAATAASCLIPQLTVAGIWGIPVLGFALIVGAIFRGVVPAESMGDATLVLLIHLCMFVGLSTLGLTMNGEVPIGIKVATVLAYSAILVWTMYVDHAWITEKSMNGTYHWFCAARRVVVMISSAFLLLAYITEIEELKVIMKPIVVFCAYTTPVYIFAIHCGILRQEGFGQVGWWSIQFNRLRALLSASLQPGVLLKTVTIYLVTFQVFCTGLTVLYPVKYLMSNWIIPQFVYASVCGLAFYVASKYDPRKPPANIDTQKHRRHFGILFHFLLIAVLDWALKIRVKKLEEANLVQYLIAVNIALIARFWAVTIFVIDKEIRRSYMLGCTISFWCHLFHFIITIAMLSLHCAVPDTVYEHIFVFLMKEVSNICFLSIAYGIAGGHREQQVRAVPPPLVQIPPVAAVAAVDADNV
jgi:hypothetical protein